MVRLTAPDGYTASRSYSVASAPDESNEIELTVERFEDGEVSSFLHDDVVVGDELEVRGPIGGWFVWDGDDTGAARRRRFGRRPADGDVAVGPEPRAERPGAPRRLDPVPRVDLYYADELPGPETTVVYTRDAPPGWPRPAGRLTRDDLAAAVLPDATAFVCGSSPFADAASDLLVGLGFPLDRIRVERFGPTG